MTQDVIHLCIVCACSCTPKYTLLFPVRVRVSNLMVIKTFNGYFLFMLSFSDCLRTYFYCACTNNTNLTYVFCFLFLLRWGLEARIKDYLFLIRHMSQTKTNFSSRQFLILLIFIKGLTENIQYIRSVIMKKNISQEC